MIELQELEEQLQGYFDDKCTVNGSMGQRSIMYNLDVPNTSSVDIHVSYGDDEIEVFETIWKFIEVFEFDENLTFSSLRELQDWIKENTEETGE